MALMSPIFSSAILLNFVYEMMKLISNHEQNRHTKVEIMERGDNNEAGLVL